MIERMSEHEIVCGYGRMGRAVVGELRHAGRRVVVVDSRVASPPAGFRLEAADVLVVFGSRQQILAFDDDCG